MYMFMSSNAELAKNRLAAIADNGVLLYRCHLTPTSCIVVTRRFVSPTCQMLGSRVVSIFREGGALHALITRSIIVDAALDTTNLIMHG